MTIKTIENMVSVAQNRDSVEYRVHSDLAEIRGLSQQWEDLLATSQCNKVFASLEWYLASCRMDTSGTPYVIAATRGSEVICILPLVLNPAVGVAMFPHYANDYNDVLVRGSKPALVADLLRYAMSANSPCRQLKLSKLRPDSNCLAALHLLKEDPGIECRYSDECTYPYAELPPDFEDYLASLSRRSRKNIKIAFRNATADGLRICELYPQTLDPPELPDIFFHLLLCRHSRIPLSEQIDTQSFVREVLPPMFQKGSVRVFGLLEEERIIALMLFLVAARGLLAWSGGFLAGKEHWSPGTTLYAFAIRQAIAEGHHELDFGEGDEGYKLHWTNREYRVSEVELISKC